MQTSILFSSIILLETQELCIVSSNYIQSVIADSFPRSVASDFFVLVEEEKQGKA